jgi:pimeloyl-ACP methyl ester carboxylesterase
MANVYPERLACGVRVLAVVPSTSVFRDGSRLASAPSDAHDSVVDRPQTSYAWNDGTALAYQVLGSSGPDLVLAPGSVTHLEILWEEPRVQRFLTRLAGFSRLIVMDPRGLGLSDRLTEVPTLNERVADLLAVLDAAKSERATLFGNADTGPACIATAASHPDRIGALILCGTYAKAGWSEGLSVRVDGRAVRRLPAIREGSLGEDGPDGGC